MRTPIVREIEAKSILYPSKIHDYCVNPYTGCGVGCVYCYAAQFMRRYSGHSEPCGECVDVSVNAPALLAKQIDRSGRGQSGSPRCTTPTSPSKIDAARLTAVSRFWWGGISRSRSRRSRPVSAGPLLPGSPERLAALLGKAAGRVLIDRMNYVPAVKRFYASHGLRDALEDSFFRTQSTRLARALRARGIHVRIVF